MKTVIEYLTSPLKIGVYHAQFRVDFSNFGKLVGDIAAIAKKHKAESKELSEMVKIFEESIPSSTYIIKEAFATALENFMRFNECPKEIFEFVLGKKVSDEDEAVTADSRRFLWYRMRLSRARHAKRPWEVFESHIFNDLNDVAVIDIEETTGKKVLSLEVTTLKEDGLTRFQNFLKCIPHIGDCVTVIRKRKTYSSRHAFRPYPLAVQLWLGSEEAIAIPKDLRDFLNGSVRYYSGEEWRTSIVLSAISVESILADIYEEVFKDYAPNVPLGELYYKVKDKVKFPPHVVGAIETANEARISAVHRSRFPVSDREATNALYGATTVVMWFSSDFK